LTAAAILLALFFAIDSWLYRRPEESRPDPTPDSPVRIDGMLNLLVLGPLILLSVLLSGLWSPGVRYAGYGMNIELQNVARDLALLALAWVSWRYTPAELRHANHFEWGPIVEVAKLFAGIFLTI